MSKGSERCLGGGVVLMHRRQTWQQEEIGDELAAAAVLFSVGIRRRQEQKLSFHGRLLFCA